MLDLLTADRPFSHPWYISAMAASYSSHRPALPFVFRDHVLPAFAPAFDRIGDATSHELNAYWFAQNTSVPLAAFAFAAKMRDPSSAERRGAAAALAAESDLTPATWTPRAPLQHLCGGVDDEQVPFASLRAAADAWGISSGPPAATSTGLQNVRLESDGRRAVPCRRRRRCRPPRPPRHSRTPGRRRSRWNC